MSPVPRPTSPASSRPTPDLICFSHLRWNFVFQRPQHLMSRYARAHRVFFVEAYMGSGLSSSAFVVNNEMTFSGY